MTSGSTSRLAVIAAAALAMGVVTAPATAHADACEYEFPTILQIRSLSELYPTEFTYQIPVSGSPRRTVGPGKAMMANIGFTDRLIRDALRRHEREPTSTSPSTLTVASTRDRPRYSEVRSTPMASRAGPSPRKERPSMALQREDVVRLQAAGGGSAQVGACPAGFRGPHVHVDRRRRYVQTPRRQ